MKEQNKEGPATTVGHHLRTPDLGHTHVKHKFDTGTAHPILQWPQRLPLMKQTAADQCLEEMHKAGMAEPSERPWMSPVVLVQKKDGT